MAEELIYKKYEVDIFDVQSKVDVFFTRLLSEETLTSQWKEIRNYVALNQLDLDDEFERWNFYLFYVVEVYVRVSERMDELARLKPAHLCHHHCQQRV